MTDNFHLANTLEKTIQLICSQPTAPFRESWVSTAIQYFCDKNHIPFCEDSYGNLWVGISKISQSKTINLAFVAHMDHPGMVIQKFSQKNGKYYAHGKWLGGGPENIRGMSVQVYSDVHNLMVFDGKIKSHSKGMRGPDEVLIEITGSRIDTFLEMQNIIKSVFTPKGFKTLGPWGACLWYDQFGVFEGVARMGDNWVTKAADDLVGVCAILNAIRENKKAIGSKKVVGLFTKAEESGFHGALEVLRKKMLNPKVTRVISVETSSRLPGAIPGKGPVVRLGDRATVFDPAFTYLIEKTAFALAKKNKSFTYQKKLMDGGTCEATAFNSFGYIVGGLSTPLVNYHNQFLPYEMLIGRKVRTKNPKGAHPEKVNHHDVEKLSVLVAEIIKTYKNGSELNKFNSFKSALLKHQSDETKKYFK